MVIDSSALVALLLGEPEADTFVSLISQSSVRLLSAASYLETAIVMFNRSGPDAQKLLDRLVAELAVQVIPFSPDQAALAVDAYHRFGRGSHAAGLNFGDCFTYAPAKATGEAVLFKGDDFSRTDLIAALASP